jgi:epoxyqueuosine reductase
MKKDLSMRGRGDKRRTARSGKRGSPGQSRGLKGRIIRFCRDRGVDLVGFAPAERWDEAGEVPPDFRPTAIWPMARTVIVMGLEMPLPVVETTPSVVHMEMYKTANTELDQLAYDLTRFLNRLGHASFFFPRDGFGSMRALREKNCAAFSHVMAAKYAGLGTIGASHCLLTPEFGPRVRFVSVFTAAEISPDPMLEKELCIKCEACAKCCPKKAIRIRPDRIIGEYDDQACLGMAEELVARFPLRDLHEGLPHRRRPGPLWTKRGHKKVPARGGSLGRQPGRPGIQILDPSAKIWGCAWQKAGGEELKRV